MSWPISLPVTLTVLAGLLAIGAAIAQNFADDKKEKEEKAKEIQDDAKDKRIEHLINENTSKSAENLQTSQESKRLIQDIAAQLGNSDAVRELVELRSKQLNTPSPVKESIIKAILEQLPDKINNYKALQTSKAQIVKTKEAALSLSWEATIRHYVQQFDQIAFGIQSEGYPLSIVKDDYRIFGNETRIIRDVTYKGARLILEYNTFTVSAERLLSNAELRFRIISPRDLVLETSLRFDEHMASTVSGLSPYVESGPSFQATADGLPSQEFLAYIQITLSKAFERLLLVAEAGS